MLPIKVFYQYPERLKTKKSNKAAASIHNEQNDLSVALENSLWHVLLLFRKHLNTVSAWWKGRSI